MATPAEMVTKIETALERNVGVVQVTIDGRTVRWDREQALSELSWWKRRAAIKAGRRRLGAQINLGNFP